MIHLYNLNSVTSQSTVQVEAFARDVDQEFAIYGDDDSVEDPEIDLAQVRLAASNL